MLYKLYCGFLELDSKRERTTNVDNIECKLYHNTVELHETCKEKLLKRHQW